MAKSKKRISKPAIDSSAVASDQSDAAVVLSATGAIVSASGVMPLAAFVFRSWYWPYCFAPDMERPESDLPTSPMTGGWRDTYRDVLTALSSSRVLSIGSSPSFVANIRSVVIRVVDTDKQPYRVAVSQLPPVVTLRVSSLEIDQTLPLGSLFCSSGLLGSDKASIATSWFSYPVVQLERVEFPRPYWFATEDPDANWEVVILLGSTYVRLRNVDRSILPAVCFVDESNEPLVTGGTNVPRCYPLNHEGTISLSNPEGARQDITWFLWCPLRYYSRVYTPTRKLVAYLDFGRVPTWALQEADVINPNTGESVKIPSYIDWSTIEVSKTLPIYVTPCNDGVYMAAHPAEGPDGEMLDTYSPRYGVYGRYAEQEFSGLGPDESIADDLTFLGSTFVGVSIFGVLVASGEEWPSGEANVPTKNSLSVAYLRRDDDSLETILPFGYMGDFSLYSEDDSVTTTSTGAPRYFPFEWLHLERGVRYTVQSRMLSDVDSRTVLFGISNRDCSSGFQIMFSPVLFDGSEGRLSTTDQSLWGGSWQDCFGSYRGMAMVPQFSAPAGTEQKDLDGYAVYTTLVLAMGLPYYVYVWTDMDAPCVVDITLTYPLTTESDTTIAESVPCYQYPTLVPFGAVRFVDIAKSQADSLHYQKSAILVKSSVSGSL